MKLSQMVACSCVVLIGALIALSASAEARRSTYNSAPVRYTDSYSPMMDADAGYSSNCVGYHCNYNTNSAASSSYSARQRSPYGPYHSYAVRPALYGGHKLYHYTGYARHYPAPPARHQAHYRHVRSYKPAHNNGAASYGMRPVKAVMLAPAYYASRPSGSSSSYNHGSSGQNYRHKRGYNSSPMPSNYRSPYGPAPAHVPSMSMSSGYSAGASSTRYNMRGNSMTYRPPAAGY